MRGLSGRGLLLAVVLALSNPAAAARADSGFAPPIDLPWLANSYGVRLAAAAPGETIVAADVPIPSDDNGRQQPVAAIFGPGQLSATPQELDGEAGPFGLALAADRRGDALAAWADYSGAGSVTLRVAERAPGQPFGKGVDRTGQGTVGLVDTAMNARGDAVVVFSFIPWNSDPELLAVFRPVGGEVGAPTLVAQLGPHASLPNIAVGIDDAGTATVAWHASWGSDPSDGRLQFATGDAEHAFGSPVEIRSAPTPGSTIHLGVDAAGYALLVWPASSDPSTPATIMAARRAPGEVFSEPEAIGRGEHGFNGRFEQLDSAVTTDGQALVTWVDGGADGYQWTTELLAGSTHAPGFNELPPSGDRYVIYDWPVVAAGADGQALFAGVQTFPDELTVATGSPSGGLSGLHEASCPPAVGQTERAIVGGADDMAVLVRQPQYIGVHYTLSRSLPGTPPAPESCSPPAPEPTPTLPQPPDAPTAVSISVPQVVSAGKLNRLPVSIASSGAARITAAGRLTSAGAPRLGVFRAVSWSVARPAHKRIRLRLYARPRWRRGLRHGRGVATVRVSISGAGRTRVATARVRVRR